MQQPLMDMQAAVQDFHRARQRAGLQELAARLRGEPADLLSYEEVRSKLKITSGIERGLQDVPLDAIIGSVGRYTDFTRTFLPKQKMDAQRWARVKMATLDMTGVPAIDVYQIDEAYFVKDGNHRVSVARELGFTHIQAHVTEVRSDVPLTQDTQPDDLILKAEQADFLRWADIPRNLPGVDLTLTSPGRYADLREHISVHRYYMGLDRVEAIPLGEAVRHWYETVYRPVVDAVNRLGLLRDFPGRTETDLYLWVAEHRAAVEKELGWGVDPAAAADSLASEHSTRPDRVLARVGERLAGVIGADRHTISPPRRWREPRQAPSCAAAEPLFRNILVSLDGSETGWMALEQALILAGSEQGRILGLHILDVQTEPDDEGPTALRQGFEERCRAADIAGELALSTGTIAHEVTARAEWADLLVAPLNHPPGSGPLEKLRSGLRTMIVRAPCPVLTMPVPAFPLKHAVLAYDGSPKAREALFVAAYLGCRWPDLSLMTISVDIDPRVVMDNIEEVEAYLTARGQRTETLPVASDFSSFEVASLVREAAKTHDSDLVIVGGYGHAPAVEVVLGSTVNDILRTTGRATLICR